jgi:hypothetical protein
MIAKGRCCAVIIDTDAVGTSDEKMFKDVRKGLMVMHSERK